MDAPQHFQPHATASVLTIRNHRARSVLRAAAAGRAELTCSCEPDIYIDGLPCCDQYTAHDLARRGLIAPIRPGLPGQRVPARITEEGLRALDEPQTAA